MGGVNFGRYALQRRLAVGGMAEIFVAEVPGIAGFSKKIVLKLILPELAKDPEFVAMFVNEAKLASEMTHPNIAQVLELGEVEGRYYIAMEYVSGIDLASLIRDAAAAGETVPLDIAVRIVVDILSGLHFAHELKAPDGTALNIVHRDVSPHNVLVARDGGVKVTDFGIAKASNSSSRTRSGIVKGKLAYMAPEHAFAKPLDRRADLFAAALIFYEMATGKRVYSAEDDLALIHMAREGSIPPLYQVVPAVPLQVSEIISQALAPNPEDRFEDCETFASALSAVSEKVAATSEVGAYVRSFVHDEPTGEDRLLSVTFSGPTRVRRRKKRLVTMAIAASLLVVGLVFAANWLRPQWFSDLLSPKAVGPMAKVASPPPAPLAKTPPATLPPPTPLPPVTPPPESNEPFGFLTVTSDPAALVTIDGKRLARPTPLKHFPLRPGKHNVRLLNPKEGTEEERIVEIHSGKTVQLTHRF